MKVFGRLFLVLVAALGLSACSSLPEELNASTEQVVTDYKAFAESQGEVSNDVRLGGSRLPRWELHSSSGFFPF
jgi:outer membrane lipoprotein